MTTLLILTVAISRLHAQVLPDSLAQNATEKVDSFRRTDKEAAQAVPDSTQGLFFTKEAKPGAEAIKSTVAGTKESLNQRRRSSKTYNAIDTLAQAAKSLDSLDPSKKLEFSALETHDRVRESEPVREIEKQADKSKGVVQKAESYGRGATEVIEGPKNYVEKIKNNKIVRQHTEQAEKLDKEYEGYVKEAKNLGRSNFHKKGNLQQEVEKKVRRLEEVQALEQEAMAMEKYKNKLRQLKNAESIKKQLQDKLEAAGLGNTEHVPSKVSEAMGKLAKYKKKYRRIQSSKDIPERRDNPLRGKPLKERLVVGGNFQLHQGDPVSLDVAPQVAYRFTSRLSAGIGGTYRQALKEKDGGFAVGEDVYGFRTFAEYLAVKSFFGHVEFESMSMKKAKSVGQGREWTSGILAGIGREFNVTQKVKGRVMMLYNLLHEENGPYRKPLMVRFGFRF